MNERSEAREEQQQADQREQVAEHQPKTGEADGPANDQRDVSRYDTQQAVLPVDEQQAAYHGMLQRRLMAIMAAGVMFSRRMIAARCSSVQLWISPSRLRTVSQATRAMAGSGGFGTGRSAAMSG